MVRDNLYRELKLLSYDLILESTLHVAVALYSCLVSTELLSCLNSDVLLVDLESNCCKSLCELCSSN